MKHNIQTTTPQTMTASEIENIALHIIALKGNYDFTGTNVTITPPTDMDPDMAGIIVKCAQKTGGTVNINGATEISDDVWNICKQYGYPLWMTKATPSAIPNLYKLYQKYPLIKEHITNTGIVAPIIASKSTNGIQKTWMIHSSAEGEYYKLENLMQETDFQYKVGGFANNNNGYTSELGTIFGRNTIAKFFTVESIPNGFEIVFADVVTIYINGVCVFSSGAYKNTIQQFSRDFSSVIKTNEVNLIVIRTEYNNGGIDFGFTFAED